MHLCDVVSNPKQIPKPINLYVYLKNVNDIHSHPVLEFRVKIEIFSPFECNGRENMLGM